jgi:hypothetical protein
MPQHMAITSNRLAIMADRSGVVPGATKLHSRNLRLSGCTSREDTTASTTAVYTVYQMAIIITASI